MVGTLRHAGIGVVDQALSGLTNIVVTILVARSVSPDAFSAYAVSFAVFVLCLGIFRAVWSEPLIVRFSNAGPSELSRAVRGMAPWSLLSAAAIGVVLLLAGGALWHTGLGGCLMTLGLVLPAVLMQDFVRFSYFAARRPKGAVAVDVAWAVALLVFLPLLIALRCPYAEAYIAVWGLGALLASCALAFDLRRTFAIPGSKRWMHGHRPFAVKYSFEYAAIAGTTQGMVLVLGAILGASAVAALTGAQVLFGPMNIFNSGLLVVLTAEGTRIAARRQVRRLATLAGLSSLAAGGVAAVWLTLMVVAGDRIGPVLLAESWPTVKPVVVPDGLGAVAAGLILGGLIGLRSLAEPGLSLAARLGSVPLTVAGGLIGAYTGGIVGAALGMSLGLWLSLGGWAFAFGRGLARCRSTSVVPVLEAA
jgi:O-antigen/teichoic acid export membrane protein